PPPHRRPHRFLYRYHPPRALPSFPTRRSSDLAASPRRPLAGSGPARRRDEPGPAGRAAVITLRVNGMPRTVDVPPDMPVLWVLRDRKSTRLNSSHLVISYAVFCLKKKKTTHSI